MTSDNDRLSKTIQGQAWGLKNYWNSQNKAVNDLVNIVKGEVSIDRHILGGSIGKRTFLGPNYKPDFDVYLYFNNWNGGGSNEELENLIYNNMERIKFVLRNKYANRYRVLYDSTASFAIGVLIRQTGTKVDLVPAINFSTSRSTQYEITLRRIANTRHNVPWLNSCYAEASVDFLRNQNLFVREVVRLAKYWNANRVSMGPLSGRSVIVETVAIKAAQDEMANQNWSLKRALKAFLNSMSQDWWNLCIVVYNESVDTFEWPARVVNQYYMMQDTSGVLVDPVNPYRNFLEDVSVQNKWQHFQKAAQNSLQMLYNGCYPEESIGFTPYMQ